MDINKVNKDGDKDGEEDTKVKRQDTNKEN